MEVKHLFAISTNNTQQKKITPLQKLEAAPGIFGPMYGVCSGAQLHFPFKAAKSVALKNIQKTIVLELKCLSTT